MPTEGVPRMPKSTNAAIRFESSVGPALEAAFDAGRLTSDGGLPWLAEADRALGLWAGRAAEGAGGGRGPAGSGAARPGDAGAAASVPDRVRVRGPGRRGYVAGRPAAEAGVRAAAGGRGRPGEPADAVAAGERGGPPGLLSAGAVAGGGVPVGARAGRGAGAGPAG